MNLNILRTRRAFKVKQKAFFIIFKAFLVAKICLIPESEPLRMDLLVPLTEGERPIGPPP